MTVSASRSCATHLLVLPLVAVMLASAPAAFAAHRVAKAERKASSGSTTVMPSEKAAPKPATASRRAAKSAPAAAVPAFTLPTPTPEQIDAAGRVYYGVYDCEFKQTIDIAASKAHASYVDLKLAKAAYLMKPVLSSTGAIRLEDVKGELLMVQIASKSMLLNVKTAQRIVDDCITQKQRELIEAARVAKAAQAERAAAAAAAAASATAPAAPVVPASPASAPGAAATPAADPASPVMPVSSAASDAVPDAPSASPAVAASGAAALEAAQGAAAAETMQGVAASGVAQDVAPSPQP